MKRVFANGHKVCVSSASYLQKKIVKPLRWVRLAQRLMPNAKEAAVDKLFALSSEYRWINGNACCLICCCCCCCCCWILAGFFIWVAENFHHGDVWARHSLRCIFFIVGAWRMSTRRRSTMRRIFWPPTFCITLNITCWGTVLGSQPRDTYTPLKLVSD